VILMQADSALRRAKAEGRNRFMLHEPRLEAAVHAKSQLELDLANAPANGQMHLVYQPYVDLADGGVSGVEALLRWRHPERGIVSPGEFMPVLEETGLIVPVGEWVVKAVCAQLREWQRQGIDPKAVAINLSARQFVDKDLGPTIQRILEENGVDPSLIELEITESSLMANTEESTRTLEFLAQLGCGLSIDDFGTGYSSLGYLKRFPLDALKIDRTFVRDAVTDPDDAAITLSIINLAHSLKLNVVAEGVETEGQLQFLRTHGCDEMQGFYFSRPLPVEDSTRALAEGRRLQVEHAAPAGFGR
jgi:EAL domain-containing protein (putative c-di-GMP-specific phosphodiesterase class I)